MTTDFSKPTPPSADKRWRLADATMRRLGNQSRGLIETLHTVQETFGYLDEEALRYVAVSLRVPLSNAARHSTFQRVRGPGGRSSPALLTPEVDYGTRSGSGIWQSASLR